MVRAQVDAGVCGLVSLVEARSPDGMQVMLSIESECPRVRALAAAWPADEGGATADASKLDAFQELLRLPLSQTTPARLAAEHGLHPTCLVPVAVLKAVEVAAGLALPRNCGIQLTCLEDCSEV
jgi:hypothetical protein